jgi:hypothetical protein
VATTDVTLLYRIDIGFDQARGYAAALCDVRRSRFKGVKANSMPELMRRLSEVLTQEEAASRHFPLESEPAAGGANTNTNTG